MEGKRANTKISPIRCLIKGGFIWSTSKIHLVTEPNPEDPEESDSDARTGQYWVNWQQRWSDSLSSITTASANDFRNTRIESANDPEEMIATVSDVRSLSVLRLDQHWDWAPEDSANTLGFGFRFESLEASYSYVGNADYFGLFLLVEGVPESISRSSELSLSGRSYGVYVSDEIRMGERTIARLGVRWDVQDYGNLDDASQISPRFSLAHSFGSRTTLLASVGRYYQAQGMHELQVEDDVDYFFDAQKTDSATVGIQHLFRNGLSVRAEAYWKEGDLIRPRFENILNQLTILAEYKPDRTAIAPVGFRARGAELTVRQESDQRLAWWATYVFSIAEDEFTDERVPRSWDQTHALRLGVSLTGERWDFGLIATGHSGWPTSSVELDTSNPDEPVIRFTDRNRSNYNTFATLDMRLRYRMPVRIGELTFFVEASNATNRENQCCVDFDVDTDTTDMPILLLEHDYWLPLIPAVGVLWQF